MVKSYVLHRANFRILFHIFFSELVNIELKAKALFWVRFMQNNNKTFSWTEGTSWTEFPHSLPLTL